MMNYSDTAKKFRITMTFGGVIIKCDEVIFTIRLSEI